MLRGEIWWANLPEPTGAGPGYRRPVLIIQADNYNQSRLKTVIVLLLTTNLQLADMPGNVRLPAARTGLTKDSVANITQLTTVDKQLITERCGQIDDSLMAAIERGIRQVLDL